MLASLFGDRGPESVMPAVRQACAEPQEAAGPAGRHAGLAAGQAADRLALERYLGPVLGLLLLAEEALAVM